LYNSANTKRYVAEALAVNLSDGNRELGTTTDTSVHVVPTATGLALSGRF
jgi:hypothetical protein